MPLIQRHARREGRLAWTRFWTPRGVPVEGQESGFVAERATFEHWSQNTHLRTLDELDSVGCVLALGDPALGKSWDLGEYATRLKQRIDTSTVADTIDEATDTLLAFDASELASAGSLRAKIFGEPLDRWRTETGLAYVVIDSLDEAPLGIDAFSHALLDELESVPIERLRLRLACRTAVAPSHLRRGLRRLFQATAPGDTGAMASVSEAEALPVGRIIPSDDEDVDDIDSQDLVPRSDSALSDASTHRYCEMEIVKLTHNDAHVAAVDRLGSDAAAEEFLDAVSDADAESFAAHPQTLFALIERFGAGEPLNASQEDLFRSLCLSLADPNPTRALGNPSSGPNTGRDERYRLAARISASMLLGNRPTLWLGPYPAPAAGTLDVTAITGTERFRDRIMRVTESELWEAVDTALFTASSNESGVAAHLTYAEFLTADWLTSNKLQLPQIVALLTDPNDVERRILPQLRQVAAWLAAMRQDVFDAVALAEPDIVLWSDVVQLPEPKRPMLVTALLHGTTSNTILNPPFGMHSRLGKLSHANLGTQLIAAIQDRTLPERTRELAIDIAWANRLSALCSVACNLAVDETEPIDLRALAVRLVGDLGTEGDRRTLIPLASAGAEKDVADELRGAALRATWTLMPPRELFDAMRFPKRPNWGGAYSLALREISEALGEQHSVAAAQWLASNHDRSYSSLDTVVRASLRLAIHNYEQPSVIGGLADYALGRFRRSEELFDSGHRVAGESDDLVTLVEQNRPLRRRWVTEIIERHPTNVRELFHLTYDRPQLLTRDDASWAIEQLSDLPHDDIRREAWSQAVKWGFDYSTGNIESVLKHRADPSVSELFPDLMRYASASEATAAISALRKKSNRDLAKREKRRIRAENKRRAADAPVTPGSLSGRVLECITGVADIKKRWIRCVVEILRSSAKRWEFSFNAERLAELRSLKNTAAGNEVAGAAEEYLKVADVSDDPFPDGRTMYEVIFGFVAAVSLLELSPDRFEAVPDHVWTKRMRALVGHFTDAQEEALQVAITTHAAKRAPQTAQAEFVRLIDNDAKQPRGWVRDSILDVAIGVPGVEEEITQRISQQRYDADATENLLEQLLKRGSLLAQTAALDLFRHTNEVASTLGTNGEASSPRVAAGGALLFKAPAAVWSDLWALLTTSEDIAKSFFRFAARRREFIGKIALDTLSSGQVADLYLLLDRLYPPETDPWHIGVFSPGPRDNVQNLRGSLLNALESRKSTDAVAELERIARSEPVRDYLVQLWLRARASLHGEQWSGVSPREIIRLAEESDLRIVESSSQLLDLVIESLGRLQNELQGQWRSIVNLWNESSSGNEPKSEEHLSNEVARHLTRDLASRGIAIGRELQVQIPVPGGAPGMRTDIDIQAPRITGIVPGETVPRVIVEVKGSWNRETQTAMQTQLVEKYLDPHQVTSGLYLVGYFTCDSWKKGRRYSDSLRCGTKAELEAALRSQASHLTNPLRKIRRLVMDLSLPDRTNQTAPRPRPKGKRPRKVRPLSTAQRRHQAIAKGTRPRSKRKRTRDDNAGAVKGHKRAPRRR